MRTAILLLLLLFFYSKKYVAEQFSFISVGQKNVRPKYDFWVLKTKNLIEILYLFVACDFVSVVVGWA